MEEHAESAVFRPSESHVGRALEEFREYAEDLKYRAAGGEDLLPQTAFIYGYGLESSRKAELHSPATAMSF